MRVAVVSDIHGNLPALEAVLADIAGEGVDALVVPGDTVSGPCPAEVFDLLADREALVIRGNADDEVVERRDGYGPLARWSADQLGEKRLATAAAWPLTLEMDVDGLGRVLVCHSTPSSNEPIYTRITPGEEVDAILGRVEADVLVCGHTHMQYDRRLPSGLRVVNPGSVGLPYEGRRGAFWAVLGPDVEMRYTEYDVEGAVGTFRDRGAPVDEELLRLLLEPMTSEAATAEFESLRGS